MDVARLPGCAGQAADAVSAYTEVKMKDAPRLLKIPKSECPDMWIRKFWSYIEDPLVPLERNLYGHPLAGLLCERQFEEVLLRPGCERNYRTWECLVVHRKQGLFKSAYVGDIKMGERKQNVAPMWKKWMELVDLGEPTSFLDHVCLGRTQRECKPNEIIIEEHTKMFESRISAGAIEKSPGWEKPHAKTVAWSYDMGGHAQTCVERYRTITHSFNALLGWS